MRFETQITVVGMKSSRGTLENGTAYDSTKIYALADLDTSRGNARGMAVAEYAFGDSTAFEPYRNHDFPADFMALVELVTNGRTQKTVVLQLKPVPRKTQAA